MNSSTTGPDPVVHEHWTVVDGVNTRYLEVGSGPVVLLLHGEGSVAESWYDVLKGLAGSHRAIAVDLPGYGYTEPTSEVSAVAMAVFVWRFADVLSLERPVIIGHSLGGAIAVHAALRRRDEVPALVLCNSAGMGRALNPIMVLQALTPLGDLTQALVLLLPFGPELLVTFLALAGSRHPWRISPAWWSSQVQTAANPEMLATALRYQRSAVDLLGQKDPLLDKLDELPMPTLVVWGVQDVLVPFWQAVAACRRLRRGRLRLFATSGHLVPTEAPEAFLSAVRPLLAALDAGTAEQVGAR